MQVPGGGDRTYLLQQVIIDQERHSGSQNAEPNRDAGGGGSIVQDVCDVCPVDKRWEHGSASPVCQVADIDIGGAVNRGAGQHTEKTPCRRF
jgi:hypothetical protein